MTLQNLYEKYVEKKEKDFDINTGYMNFNVDSFDEFTSWIKKFMKKFGIGTEISKKKWGDRKTKELQATLYANLEKEPTGEVSLKQTGRALRDKLQNAADAKQFTRYDFSRIARTEAANVKAIFQLQKFKEAGYTKVIHKNNPRSVARKTVSTKCQLLNNRKFDIDYLLSKQGEKDRICIHPNCMCHYEGDLKSVKQDIDKELDILRNM